MIRGELTRAQALAAGQAATRAYAKRQRTWFRNQSPSGWTRMEDPVEDAPAAARAFAAAHRLA